MILTVILVRGIRESARANNIMVLVKIPPSSSSSFSEPASSSPTTGIPSCQRLDGRPHRRFHHLLHLHRIRFRLHGRRGVQESSTRHAHRHSRHPHCLYHPLRRSRHRPQRHRPLAVRHGRRGAGSERTQKIVTSTRRRRIALVRLFVLVGALMGMISSISSSSLARPASGSPCPRRTAPRRLQQDSRPVPHSAISTWVAGFVVGIPAGLLDIGTVSNLSNIGTLFAFVLVSIAVLILRYREPERPRGFRTPLARSFLSSASSSASCS